MKRLPVGTKVRYEASDMEEYSGIGYICGYSPYRGSIQDVLVKLQFSHQGHNGRGGEGIVDENDEPIPLFSHNDKGYWFVSLVNIIPILHREKIKLKVKLPKHDT